MCSIITYNDDEFSHWLFFLAFILLNCSLMFIQIINPIKDKLQRIDIGLLVFNALFIATGIFANLSFEKIGYDLCIVILMAIVSTYLLFKHKLKPQPLIVYYAVSFTLGAFASLATIVYRGSY